jgi:hypothetical protein
MSVLDVLSLVAAAAVLLWFMWYVMRRNREEDRWIEDENREFFDAHGHWPDETAEEAEAERLRLAAAGGTQAAVSRPSSDGLV